MSANKMFKAKAKLFMKKHNVKPRHKPLKDGFKAKICFSFVQFYNFFDMSGF